MFGRGDLNPRILLTADETGLVCPLDDVSSPGGKKRLDKGLRTPNP